MSPLNFVYREYSDIWRRSNTNKKYLFKHRIAQSGFYSSIITSHSYYMLQQAVNVQHEVNTFCTNLIFFRSAVL